MKQHSVSFSIIFSSTATGFCFSWHCRLCCNLLGRGLCQRICLRANCHRFKKLTLAVGCQLMTGHCGHQHGPHPNKLNKSTQVQYKLMNINNYKASSCTLILFFHTMLDEVASRELCWQRFKGELENLFFTTHHTHLSELRCCWTNPVKVSSWLEQGRQTHM